MPLPGTSPAGLVAVPAISEQAFRALLQRYLQISPAAEPGLLELRTAQQRWVGRFADGYFYAATNPQLLGL